MPDSPPNTRQQMVDLIDIIKQSLAAAEERINVLIQRQQTPSKEDIVLVKKLRGLVKSLGQHQAEFFLATKEMREGYEGENQRLRQSFETLKEEVKSLIEELEKLSAPPSAYGVFRSLNQDGTATITSGGREYKVSISPRVDKTLLKSGRKVVLNEGMNIIDVDEYETRGEEVTVKDILSDTRVMVTMRADEIQIVERAEPLRGTQLKAGDKVLLDIHSGYITERLPKGEITDLYLEEVPNTSYEAIGGLRNQIERIRGEMELPYLYPEFAKSLGITPAKGILLYGPPGCGKSMIGKALAFAMAKGIEEKTGAPSKAYFLNIKGPELLNKYVGETERKIREIFAQAREKGKEGFPIMIFFDEAESFTRMRGSGISSDMESTIVPQLLVEMDGVHEMRNVVVVFASNRQDLIDPALLRPGRTDIKIEIPRPGPNEGYDIALKYLTPNLPVHSGIANSDITVVINRLKENAPDDWQRLIKEQGFELCPARSQIVREDGYTETWNIKTSEEKMRFLAYRFMEDLYLKNNFEPHDKAREIKWQSRSGKTIYFDNRCGEITYQSGKKEFLWIADMVSGASICGMIEAAKKRAFKRAVASEGKDIGLAVEDLYDAKREEILSQGATLGANTFNPDDWGRIAGKAGERIVNLQGLKTKAISFMRGSIVTSEKQEKPVEDNPVGHYL